MQHLTLGPWPMLLLGLVPAGPLTNWPLLQRFNGTVTAEDVGCKTREGWRLPVGFEGFPPVLPDPGHSPLCIYFPTHS